jgi:putative flippase GtrA
MRGTAPPRGHLWQVIRYLAVGAFNTAFGFVVFVSLNYLFRRFGVLGSEAAMLLANLISITVAFLGYKWFVFHTRGNYLREWLRCLSVYGTGVVFSLVALAPLALLLRRRVVPDLLSRPGFGAALFRLWRNDPHQVASNLAAAMLTVVTVIASYFGHKYFSFRRSGGDALDAVLESPPGSATPASHEVEHQ